MHASIPVRSDGGTIMTVLLLTDSNATYAICV
jgi:hypothetical protein